MILPDFSIKLLEVNRYPGLKHDKIEMEEFYTKFFDGIFKRTVDVVCKPNISSDDDNWININ